MEETSNQNNLDSINIITYINELMSQTTVIQHFKNTRNEPIELEMIIPQLSNINITKFEMIKNNKKIVSRLLEKEKAKEKYSDTITTGDSSFISYNQETETEICLGNVAPGDEIELKTYFFGHIKNKDLSYQARFPIIFPEFSLNDPNKGENLDYYRYSKKDVNGKIYINTQSKITRLVISGSNNFNKIEKKYGNDKKSCEITIFKKDFSDKDIPGIILFRTENINDEILYYQYDEKKNKSYYMLRKTLFVPELSVEMKDEIDENENINYISLIKNDENLINEKIKVLYIFLIDQSGSMTGERIDLCSKSLLLFLQSLDQNCYFQLIGFGSNYQYYSDKPLEYNKTNIQNLMEIIKNLRADKGGTELFAPLTDIYKNKIYNEYNMNKHIILLTDGELFDKEKVINLIGSKSEEFIFNSIGIGDCDKDLIQRTALMGKGYSNYIENLKDLNSVIISLLEKTKESILVNCETSQKTFIQENKEKYIDKYGFVSHGFILNKKDINDNIEFNIKIGESGNDIIKVIFPKNKITKLPNGDKLGKLIVDNYLKSGICKDSNTIVHLSKDFNILTNETAFYAEITNENPITDNMLLVTNKNKEASNNNNNNEDEKNDKYIFKDEHFSYDDNNKVQNNEPEKKGFFEGLFSKIFSKDNIIKKKNIKYKEKRSFKFPSFHIFTSGKDRRRLECRACYDIAAIEEDCCDFDDGYVFKSNCGIRGDLEINDDLDINKDEEDEFDITKKKEKEVKKEFKFDELILSQDIIEGYWTKDSQIEILITQEKDMYEKIKKYSDNKGINEENGVITLFILYYIYNIKKEKLGELKFVLNKARVYIKKIFKLEYADIVKEIETKENP